MKSNFIIHVWIFSVNTIFPCRRKNFSNEIRLAESVCFCLLKLREAGFK